MTHAQTCLECPHHSHPCAGPCPCTIDGQDIVEHIRAGQCPKDRFTGSPEPAPQLYPEQIAIAEARAGICEGCPECRKVSREVGGWQVYTVACNKCGCAGLSLVGGECPVGLWASII